MKVKAKVTSKGLLAYPSPETGKDLISRHGDIITVSEEVAAHLVKHRLAEIIEEKPAYKVEPPAPVDVKVTTKKR